MPNKPEELHPQFFGLQAVHQFAPEASASRGVMFGTHFTQHLIVDGLEDRILFAGPELELAKYPLSVNMPEDGKIVATIDRYPAGITMDSIVTDENNNPETLVIYETKDRVFDCFVIPRYRCFHQYFGWRTVAGPGLEMLRYKEFIEKGTVFVNTPGVKDGNSYAFGINAKVAQMAIPGVAEDGLVVSESFRKRLGFYVYETRQVSWGDKVCPVHIYGPNKSFPEIGEMVRSDGLLMSLRNYEADTAAVDLGVNSLQQINWSTDNHVYTRLTPGRVINLEIIANNNPNKNLPTGMGFQADRYVRANREYYNKILKVEMQLREQAASKAMGASRINVSPAFSKLLVRARAMVNYNGGKIKQPLKLLHRKEPIDEYFAVFTIEHKLIPDTGDKLSNCSGS